MAMASLHASVPWSSFDAIDSFAIRRPVPRSEETRDVVAMGLSSLDGAISRIRGYLSGRNKDALVPVFEIRRDLAGDVFDITDHIDVVIDHMVANGELVRVGDTAVRRTDRMPVTRQRVTRRR